MISSFRRYHGEISVIPLCVHHPHWMSHMICNAICNHITRIEVYNYCTFVWYPLLLHCGVSSALVSMKEMRCELVLTMRQVHDGAGLIHILCDRVKCDDYVRIHNLSGPQYKETRKRVKTERFITHTILSGIWCSYILYGKQCFLYIMFVWNVDAIEEESQLFKKNF